jgi:hypothetical protein
LPGTRGADGFARYDTTLTYRELDTRSDAIAAGLARRGIARGTRAVVMVRPTPEFFLLMFALFKAGAVPVLVDPGIDRRALKQCLDEAQPEAFIGIPLAHVARVLLGWAKSARVRVTTGARAGWPTHAGAGRARRRAGCIATRFVEDGGHPTRRGLPRSCSPAAPPAYPRACCIATVISSRRSRCCARRSESKPMVSTCRRSRPSRCSIRRWG